MPHVHVRPRGRPTRPFVVGMGQIDFGATRVPTGGTTNIALVPKITMAPNLAIPGYVNGAPSGPPRTTLLDTPATRIMGGPSVLGARNTSPLPTGYVGLDTGVHSARESGSSPPETGHGGEVGMTPSASPDGGPVSTNGYASVINASDSSSGPISVDGTVDVPPVNNASSYGLFDRFRLPFGLKAWHLAVVGGLAVGAVILMKKRK